MDDCAACASSPLGPDAPKWKAPLLFAAAVIFCPCHLPATIGGIAALGVGLGGAGWILSQKPIVYAVFSAIYLVTVVLIWKWWVRTRDREHEREELHRAHQGQA